MTDIKCGVSIVSNRRFGVLANNVALEIGKLRDTFAIK